MDSSQEYQFKNRILQKSKNTNSLQFLLCCPFSGSQQLHTAIRPTDGTRIKGKQSLKALLFLRKDKEAARYGRMQHDKSNQMQFRKRNYITDLYNTHQISQTIIEHPKKVSFTYANRFEIDNNRQTNNFFMDKCIIHPQKIDIFVQRPNSSRTETCDESKLRKTRKQYGNKFDQLSNHSDSFASTNLIDHELHDKLIDLKNTPSPSTPLGQQFSNFSFGKHQRGQLLARLLGNTEHNEVQSKRQSYEEEQIRQTTSHIVDDAEESNQPEADDSFLQKDILSISARIGSNPEQVVKPIRKESYRRGSLFNNAILRRSQTLNDPDSDNQSEVVQDHDYKSMMGKIHQNRLEDSNSSQDF